MLVVQLAGELFSDGAEPLAHLLDAQLAGPPLCRVIVDLTDVAVISAGGIQLLVDLHRRVRTAGLVLLLVGLVNRNVERSLRLAGALPLFSTCPSVGRALAGMPTVE